jgi:hypothetical protein
MSAGARPQPMEKKPIYSSALVRIGVTAGAIAVWFWTQSLIGARKLDGLAIGDKVHDLSAPLNHYFALHTTATNGLLIASSAIIDLLGLYLLGKWVFGRSLRPFLGLVIVLGLRQIMQGLVALPAPTGDLWHYPGFPSLLVTYGVANDFFFSGHTSIAVLGATELWREGKPWLRVLAVGLAAFEITTVLVLRAHYTMDVFTGFVTAILAAVAAEQISKARV